MKPTRLTEYLSYILLFFIAVGFAACDNGGAPVGLTKYPYKEDILGNWRLVEAKLLIAKDAPQDDNSNLPLDLQADLLGNKLVTSKYLLNIYSDSSYHLIQDYRPEIGTWKFLNGKSILFGQHGLAIGAIEKEFSRKILVGVLVVGGKKLRVKFISDLFRPTDCRLDPFHPDNNQWRIPAQEKETFDQIRLRLANYLLHVALIHKLAHDGQKEVLSFEHSQGIIGIYKRGIGLLNTYSIHDSWKDCFFDEEDAFRAHNLLSIYMPSGIARGNRDNPDWLHENYLILLRLYEEIKSKSIAEPTGRTPKSVTEPPNGDDIKELLDSIFKDSPVRKL